MPPTICAEKCEFVSKHSKKRCSGDVLKSCKRTDRASSRLSSVRKAGKMVIPAQFDAAAGFWEGLALVRVGKKFGYIDKSGKYVWAPTK